MKSKFYNDLRGLFKTMDKYSGFQKVILFTMAILMVLAIIGLVVAISFGLGYFVGWLLLKIIILLGFKVTIPLPLIFGIISVIKTIVFN